jgi:hypothetical protein
MSVTSDITTGILTINESWSVTATGSNAAPIFLGQDAEIIFSYTNLDLVEALKTFNYDYIGKTENRYLETYYRISRDSNSWTNWFELNSPNIDNFPPYSSRFPMFLDIKFVRGGSSEIGTIKLLEFTITAALERIIYSGESVVPLNQTQDTVIIKPPYIYKVFKIRDVEVISSGTMSMDFDIKYRYSQDYGRTVTDWEYFTKENIISVRISPIRFFQIEYLVELKSTQAKIYDINLIGDFQNVSLDYFKTNLYGVRADCNCLKLGIVNDPSTFPGEYPGDNTEIETIPHNTSILPILSQEQIDGLFKPYSLDAATALLDKMSNDANQMFGHEIVYFLTDPDKKGIDYTFHEYQLYNYVSNCLIKASVEGNQFPENNGAINQFDLSLFDSFEIHIPKQIFKNAFGVDKRPSKEDFLWFCEINKMFTVEHSQAFRGFNNNAIYYKLMLKKYNQKANVIGVNQTITDKLRDLTRNSTIDELFGLENIQDKQAVANKDQHKPLTIDPIRTEITARIVKELIENAEVIISTTHYDMSSVDFGLTYSLDGVVYKNMKNNFEKGDNISYMCWFNINNYTINDTYNLFNYYDSVNNLGLDININNNLVTLDWSDTAYGLTLSSALEEEVWYAYLVNINQRQRKIEQYIYKRNVDDESEASSLNSTILKKVYYNSLDLTPIEFELENINAKILSGDFKITNIRLFNDVIPENQHNKILNQAIIRDDAKYLIFADNANQRLVLPNYSLGMNKPGGV